MAGLNLRRLPLIVGGGVVVSLLALVGIFYWENTGLRSENSELREEITQTIAANAAQQSVIQGMIERNAVNNALLARAARDRDEFDARLRDLQRRAREATVNETTLDVRISPGLADALCMQREAASGRLADDYPRDAAGNPDAGAGHSPAARCGSWRDLTYRHVVEWVGDLLGHAGLERRDKAALREWAAGKQPGE